MARRIIAYSFALATVFFAGALAYVPAATFIPQAMAARMMPVPWAVMTPGVLAQVQPTPIPWAPILAVIGIVVSIIGTLVSRSWSTIETTLKTLGTKQDAQASALREQQTTQSAALALSATAQKVALDAQTKELKEDLRSTRHELKNDIQKLLLAQNNTEHLIGADKKDIVKLEAASDDHEKRLNAHDLTLHRLTKE